MDSGRILTSCEVLKICKRKLFKALANEDTLLQTQWYRHKCFPVCPCAQHLLQTQILCPGHKKLFLIFFRNILCLHQTFPSLRSMETQHSFCVPCVARPRDITSNNVSVTLCTRLPGPLKSKRVSETRAEHS